MSKLREEIIENKEIFKLINEELKNLEKELPFPVKYTYKSNGEISMYLQGFTDSMFKIKQKIKQIEVNIIKSESDD